MKNRDMAIAEAVRDSLKEVVWDTDSDDRNGVMIDMDEVDLASIIASVPVDVEPVEIDWPDYHDEAMGCGLEDRNITDRYIAMRYGWDCAIERLAEQLPEILYVAPPDAASIRRAAIEECAKVCEAFGKTLEVDVGDNFSEEIRALLDKEPAQAELTDDEIDSCRRSGLIDSLLDPYDRDNSGDEISSMHFDLRYFARAVIAADRAKRGV